MAETHTPAAQGRPPARRKTNKKILLSILGILVAIPVIAIVIILTFDWNRARPWINAKVSDAIDRPFAIRGNLDVEWERPAKTMTPEERSWRDHIPWPHLIANDVHVGNPAGLPAQDMASVRQFSFSLNPFGLLHRTIGIPLLRFDGPRVDLLRTDREHNNWTFKRNEEKSRWNLDLERVVLTEGVVHIKDAVTKSDVTALVRTLDKDKRYGVGWTLDGTYNGAKVVGGGKAGAVLSLKQQGTPYPVQAEMRSGRTRIALEGTVTRPSRLAAIDLKLELAGASMDQLYNFTGVVLPTTGPFSTSGRLTGTLGEANSRWVYDGFKGKVGSSDIGGRLEYATGSPRPKLSGNVRSKQLVFTDLAPLIGADSNAAKKERNADVVQPTGKVLPVEEFKTERWNKLDADVRYAADRIIRDTAFPISKLSTHLKMENAVLTLEPLEFAMAGGTVRSNIRLDGRGREGPKAIKAQAKVAARNIEIAKLFPKIEQMKATVGNIDGEANLTAQGNSVASLLAGSNGELKTLISKGQVSKMLLEMMGLNVANIVITKLFGDKQVQLNCMATDFAVTNGVARTRTFVVDTQEALITVAGAINLADEQMDLRIDPKTKAVRIFSLRSPLYVRGPFSNPDVSIDKGVLAMKAGGAAILAAVAAPIAALIPLINTGPGESTDCARLLAVAREKPQAPPPGKVQRR
ncbi:AsmA family protein [Telluria aromaticivorans]|uniref:AsmA family protein n=1 Tax=Telluria aromaticivorans TaxID=2725995 RepID=A0A7Y2K044_9BURK|nr:AsmA family protein [Telluria aromaticivorans]NNG23613.1 AsmA family protein [Telluria aromaticivorans]